MEVAERKINCCKHKQKYNFVASHRIASTWATYLWHASTYAIYCNPIARRDEAEGSYLFGKLRLYRTQTEPKRTKPGESHTIQRAGKAKQKAKHQQPTPCWMRRSGWCWWVGGPVGGRHHHKSLGWDPGPMYPLFVMLVKHFARDRLTIFRFWYPWVLSLNICLGDRNEGRGELGGWQADPQCIQCAMLIMVSFLVFTFHRHYFALKEKVLVFFKRWQTKI